MKRDLLIRSVLAALAMFVWGFLFWTTPLGKAAMSHGADPDRVQSALDELFPSDGVYFVPDLPEGQSQERWLERHRRGPLGMVILRRAGANPMDPLLFVNGFLHMLITCVLIAWLLGKAAPALHGWGAKAGFVALAGFAATFWGHAGDPVWFYHPWKFHLLSMVYDLVAWTLAGAILARFAKAEGSPAEDFSPRRGGEIAAP